jgi:hypothetical protein
MPLSPRSPPSWRQDIQSLADFRTLVTPLLGGMPEPPLRTLALVGHLRSRQVQIYPWSEPVVNEIRDRLASLDIAVVEGPPPREARIRWPETEADPRPPLVIPGMAQALLFRNGFWSRLNAELHTMFDEFETDPIAPEIARGIQDFIGRYVGGYIEDHPDEAEVPRALFALADYVAASSNAGATLRTDF